MSKALNPYAAPMSETDSGPGFFRVASRVAGLMLAGKVVRLFVIAARGFEVPLLIVYILLCLLACRISTRRGYGIFLGLFLGLVFPVVGWLIVALMPRTSAAREQDRIERETQGELKEASQLAACPKCGRHNSIKTRVCPRCDHHLLAIASNSAEVRKAA